MVVFSCLVCWKSGSVGNSAHSNQLSSSCLHALHSFEENVTLLTVSNSSVFSLLLDFEKSACVFRVTPHFQQYLPNFTSSANYLTSFGDKKRSQSAASMSCLRATIPRRNYAKGGSAGQYVVQRIWPFGFRSWSSFSSKLCCSLPRPSQLEKLRPAPLSRYNTASFRASSCP